MDAFPGYMKFLQRNTLPRRRLMGERFRVVRTLGRGSFGEVVLVEDRTANGARAVVKNFRRKEAAAAAGEAMERQIQDALVEARVMASFNDDGIVRLMDLWFEESQGVVCFLMEYCPGGDLEAYMQKHYPLTEELLLHFFLQCLLALAQVHTKEIVHRDVKPSNILLGRKGRRVPTLKVADFGLSAFCSEDDGAVEVSVLVGTPLFMSPETIAEGLCGYGSDVWSLGVVFYRMMTNLHPFLGNSMGALRRSITTGAPPHPSLLSRRGYSLELGDLVMSMLEKHPFARPSMRQLIFSPLFARALLQCPWRSRRLRGALCLFACHTDYAVPVLAAPRFDASIVGVLEFGDHAFVANEVHARAAPGPRSLSPEISTAATDSLPGVVVWCHVVAPWEGYCLKYERGRATLRHVGDCTQCGPIVDAETLLSARDSSPEQTLPSAVPLTQTSCSPAREKSRSNVAKNILSSFFRNCG
ncbi:putative protein kinase [Trypanosoma conorhini]|uniref:non-specific serine/threonine protein kinase n=1 Tax=Trypanosoma conorhini TaxID=83891 RepID=A0A422P570_9TRYP|nr:putative protein kinase [Trypanosoma conorhini]RNF12814.1 putative protein kinase [Trypanosoma conorhini]